MSCSECDRVRKYMASDPELYRGEARRCVDHLDAYVMTGDGTDPPRLEGAKDPVDFPRPMSHGEGLLPSGWKEGTVDEFMEQMGGIPPIPFSKADRMDAIGWPTPRPLWRRVLGSALKGALYGLAFVGFCFLVAWAAIAFGAPQA